MPDRPFFVYLAPGATHAPHHVPKEWADKYKGQFDDGWDVQRERTFARQKELGVIPADAELTERNPLISAWDDMPDDLKPVLARQMEVYAGFLEHTDHHVGRVIDASRTSGILDNTLIYFIIGDNGASAEGTMNGAFNEMANFNGMAALETPEFMRSKVDELGSPSSYNHYSVGWAWAMDTPFQWTKQIASHWGGTRNGTIVHWPAGIADRGGLRSQFTPRHRRRADDPRGGRPPGAGERQRRDPGAHRGHQHDLQLRRRRRAGAARPAVLRDVRQPRHLPPGLERGHQAQDAVAARRPQREVVRRRRLGAVRRLDRLQPGAQPRRRAARAAGEPPAAVADRGDPVQRPADGRPDGRAAQPGARGRPTLIRGSSQLFFPGMGRLSENSVVSIKNKSFSVTAEAEVPERGASGVIIAQGGRFGGWALYAKDGRARFVYNTLGIHEFTIEAESPVPAGTHQVRMEFAYDGGGLAKGGTVTLYTDGTAVGSGRVEATQPMIFSADETTDIGFESGTTVSPEYTAHGSRFSGRIHWVQLDWAGRQRPLHLA